MMQPDEYYIGPNAPGSEEGSSYGGAVPSRVRGSLKQDAPLAKLVWFKSGGAADYLFEPADLDDLTHFLGGLEPGTSVMALGLGSNLIIRDGGVPGVVVRLGKAFSSVEVRRDNILECGGGAPGILVASTARDAGISGMSFLRGIPGTVGGFVRMNGGAYGSEVADILVDADVVMPDGAVLTIPVQDLDYSYRHSRMPDGAIVVSARFQGEPGDPEEIGEEMDRIAAEREASQPLRTKTGGSTFKNPSRDANDAKAWQLVDKAGCRGLRKGDAQVSEKHCNFLINLDNATSSDIELLGEEVRRKVADTTGVNLEWEIKRVGRW